MTMQPTKTRTPHRARRAQRFVEDDEPTTGGDGDLEQVYLADVGQYRLLSRAEEVSLGAQIAAGVRLAASSKAQTPKTCPGSGARSCGAKPGAAPTPSSGSLKRTCGWWCR